MIAKPTPTRTIRKPAFRDSANVYNANRTANRELQRGHSARPAGLLRTAGVALAAVVPAVGAAAMSRAGTVLVSRDSYIHAVGGPGAAGAGAFAPFDLSSGTTGFDRFADGVSNLGQGPDSGQAAGGPAPVVSEAHQYSAPGVMPDGLEGAFAEGSVRAGVNIPRGTASAASNFDLTFRVVGAPTGYEFGAAMGTAGGGRVTAELVPLADVPAAAAGTLAPSARRPIAVIDPGPLAPVFVTRLAPGVGDSKELDNTGLLAPGLYALHVRADSDGAAGGGGESSAYYTVNLTLTPTAAAVPLPPAAWPGLGVMASMVGTYGLRRWAGRKRTL